MMALLRKARDGLFGAGEAAVTVPPMDGAFQPNTALDRAGLLAGLVAPDNLVADGGRLLLTSGADLLELAPDGAVRRAETFGAPVSALAADGQGGLAVALDGGGLILRRGGMEHRIAAAFDGAGCITALAFGAGGVLFAATGSSRHRATDWARNLLEGRRDGALWRIAATGEATRLAAGLGWPAGLVLRDGQLVVAEAWAHRLVALPAAGGVPRVLLDNLPAYPGRLAPAAGGLWLCCFAPRSQLIEFVLREPAFRRRMMAEVPPDCWVAPALRSGQSFREPLQGGAVRQLGVLKPWAPTRSYGLVVRLDADFRPRQSLHSRADGTRHGITSALETGGRLIVTARGGDAVLALSPKEGRK